MDCAGVEQFDISGTANFYLEPWDSETRTACSLFTWPVTKDASLHLEPKAWSFDGYGEMTMTTNDPARIALDLPVSVKSVQLIGADYSSLYLQQWLLDSPAKVTLDGTEGIATLTADCCSIELTGVALAEAVFSGPQESERFLGEWAIHNSSYGGNADETHLSFFSDFSTARVALGPEAISLQADVRGALEFEELSLSMEAGTITLLLSEPGTYNFTGMLPELPEDILHDPDASRVISLDASTVIIEYSGGG